MEKKKHHSNQLLIIFYRNPQLGKVKTRLAVDIGDADALGIYLILANHTKSVTEPLDCDKIVFYSDHIDTEDNWANNIFAKAIQQGNDLGEKMKNAFTYGFASGYSSICIIGTDCFELSGEVISEAFGKLSSHDAVIGPAKDGGYYLLGMNKIYEDLFQNKKWSSDSVAKETIKDFKWLNLKYHVLPELRDVDTKEDIPKELI